MYNVLLSFPRSGNSWVRYGIEYVSKKPTVAAKSYFLEPDTYKKQAIGARLDIGVDLYATPILLKRHFYNENSETWTNNDKFILLIRDYKECILRNVSKNTDTKIIKSCKEYINNIEYFENFDGDKIVIFYEDLIINPKKEFNKIFNFLNLSDFKTRNDFIKNINKHKVFSINAYHTESVTQGSVNKLNFHSKRTPNKWVKLINNTIRENCDEKLYNKYLIKYGEY